MKREQEIVWGTRAKAEYGNGKCKRKFRISNNPPPMRADRIKYIRLGEDIKFVLLNRV